MNAQDPDPQSGPAPAAASPSPRAARVGPRSPADLFTAFTVMAMQGFGGVLAVVHRELVERRGWLSDAEFIEEWAVAQVLPGPNVCNLALMYGWRQFGWRGALAALAGLLCLPLLLLVAVATGVRHGADVAAVQGVLRGMGAVAVGIVAAAGLKLLWALRRHRLGPWVAGLLVALALAGLLGLRAPLMAVLAGVGGLAWAGTWWRLRRTAATEGPGDPGGAGGAEGGHR